MATNVGKSKTKEKVGPASVTVSFGGDKELKIGSFSIIDNGKISENPLEIGTLEANDCVINDKGECYREYNGKKVKVSPNKIEDFKNIAKIRKQKEDKDR